MYNTHCCFCLYLTGEPWDVTNLNTDNVVVTLLGSRCIQYVKLSNNKMAAGRTVDLGRVCQGIESSDTQMFVAVRGGDGGKCEVIILGHDATQIRRLPINVSVPLYLAVDTLTSRLYISDWVNEQVVCMDMAGTPIYTYRPGKHGGGFRGLLVTTGGHLLVCDSTSHKLHLVDTDGKFLQYVLTKTDGLKSPLTVSYRHDGVLFVGMGNTPSCRVFDLKQK